MSARVARLLDDRVAAAIVHHLGRTLRSAHVPRGVQEVPRVPPDLLVLVHREHEQLPAVLVRALADERNLLEHLVLRGGFLDALVGLAEERVVPSDPLLGDEVRLFFVVRFRWPSQCRNYPSRDTGNAERSVSKPTRE